MKKKNTVFVGILGDDEIHVSKTLKGLCRLMKLKYEATAKAWKRWSGAGGEIKEDDTKEIGGCEMKDGKTIKTWRIMERDFDTTWRKGNKEFGKTIKAPKKGEVTDSKAHQTPEKNRMGYDEVVNTWKEGDPE